MPIKAGDFQRHPAAIACDAWLASDEGKACAAGTAFAEYLQNRLFNAFMAGWNAASIEPTSLPNSTGEKRI